MAAGKAEDVGNAMAAGRAASQEHPEPGVPALDPLPTDGPLAAMSRLRAAGRTVTRTISMVSTIETTERPGSRAAARVMEEGTTKVFVYDPLDVTAVADLLGRRDGAQVIGEARAAMASGWRLVFGGQSKKWGCSVASLVPAPEGAPLQAERPRTAIMTRHQLPVILGDDTAAYGFVLRLEAHELQLYARARHSRRNYDCVPIRALTRQRDGRSFAEERCVAFVLRPEPMALFTAPTSYYLDALRSTLRTFWQLEGLVVRDGRGKQIMEWEEPHGAMRYEDDEPLKPLLVSVGEQRRWKRSEADRSVQKLHAVGIFELSELVEALGGGPQMRPQTLNRRLRKAGFKVFGKEAIALLSEEITKCGALSEHGEDSSRPQPGAAGADTKAAGEGGMVAHAMAAAVEGDAGVERAAGTQV